MNRKPEEGYHSQPKSAEEAKAKQKKSFANRMQMNLGGSTVASSANTSGSTAPKTGLNRLGKKTKVILIIICCALLLIAVFIGAFLLWKKAPTVEATGLKVQVTATPEPTAVGEITPTPSPTAEPAVRKENVYTLLVVGADAVALNTDTIMVVRMDCENHTINVVTLPRDTLMNVSWNVKKLNSVYGYLGIDGFVENIENLVGFDIDNYVIVNTYIFRQLIDCIGGVYFDVPFGMVYNDPDQGLYICISEGYQLLNGTQCEGLVRYRIGYANGDLGRIEMQQSFMKAAAKQILSVGNIKELPEMIDIILEYTDTDLTSANIGYYAKEFLKMDIDDIKFETLPCENVTIYGGSYVSILLDEWLDMINSDLNPWSVDVQEENLDILTYYYGNFYSTTGNYSNTWNFYDYNQAAAEAAAATETSTETQEGETE